MKDIMGMMKKVQEMQSKMAALQDELENIDVEGASGGGMVKVVRSAKGTVKAVTIDETLMKPEEKDILEDLLVAAINDARTKADQAAQDRMASLTAGLPIPPGLKLF
ncbi:MAG: YbaB/EbfC family nucleoid-associated protein [Alsobacter sp.]|nr:YbaB/EbfC family nucleoid-associated protein [Burkholderiales bacterium]